MVQEWEECRSGWHKRQCTGELVIKGDGWCKSRRNARMIELVIFSRICGARRRYLDVDRNANRNKVCKGQPQNCAKSCITFANCEKYTSHVYLLSGLLVPVQDKGYNCMGLGHTCTRLETYVCIYICRQNIYSINESACVYGKAKTSWVTGSVISESRQSFQVM